MSGKFLIVMGVSIFVLAGAPLAYGCASCGCQAPAALDHEHAEAATRSKASKVKVVTEVGNKICPVTGNKIVPEEAVKVTYEGKLYNLCCAGCIEAFKSEPQKFIQKIKETMEKEAK